MFAPSEGSESDASKVTVALTVALMLRPASAIGNVSISRELARSMVSADGAGVAAMKETKTKERSRKLSDSAPAADRRAEYRACFGLPSDIVLNVIMVTSGDLDPRIDVKQKHVCQEIGD